MLQISASGSQRGLELQSSGLKNAGLHGSKTEFNSIFV